MRFLLTIFYFQEQFKRNLPVMLRQDLLEYILATRSWWRTVDQKDWIYQWTHPAFWYVKLLSCQLHLLRCKTKVKHSLLVSRCCMDFIETRFHWLGLGCPDSRRSTSVDTLRLYGAATSVLWKQRTSAFGCSVHFWGWIYSCGIYVQGGDLRLLPTRETWVFTDNPFQFSSTTPHVWSGLVALLLTQITQSTLTSKRILCMKLKETRFCNWNLWIMQVMWLISWFFYQDAFCHWGSAWCF